MSQVRLDPSNAQSIHYPSDHHGGGSRQRFGGIYLLKWLGVNMVPAEGIEPTA
jgi:hypothetical protein